MKRFVASLLLAVASLVSAHETDLSVYNKAKQAFVTVSYNNMPGCGGTAIDPHHVITSTHCILYTQEMPRVNGHKSVEVVRDGFDSIILRTDHTFTHWVPVAAKPPYIGEEVFVWNNPSGVEGVLFKGYRSGELDNVLSSNEIDHVVLYDMQGFSGSSGSGIFNYKGELVGTISNRPIWVTLDDRGSLAMVMTMMGSRPYQFTKQQWAKAGVKPRSRQ